MSVMDFNVDQLREVRLIRRWSRSRLGQLSGVHHKTIKRIEERESNPRPITVGKLCDALGIGMKDVIRNRKEPE